MRAFAPHLRRTCADSKNIDPDQNQGMKETPNITAVPLLQAARQLRVPARWLREEVESGRIPALVADRAILIHVPTVRDILADRAKREGGKP